MPRPSAGNGPSMTRLDHQLSAHPPKGSRKSLGERAFRPKDRLGLPSFDRGGQASKNERGGSVGSAGTGTLPFPGSLGAL